jgi:tetratricopeptide (TPR) repeat protein/predicted aspartyl protease
MGGRSILNLIAGVLVASFAAASRAEAAPGKCQLSTLAELHVTMAGDWPVVEVTINDKPARLVVDTGAFFSLLTPAAAEKFQLKPRVLPVGFYLQGAVGSVPARAGAAQSFGIGKGRLKDVDFLIAGDDLGKVDGLLGQNVLGQMDVEYDFANGVVRVFKAQSCENALLAYWAQGPYSVLPISPTTPLEPHIRGSAKVNDLPIRVMFDTGAARSVLKLSTALRAGATVTGENASPGDTMRGIGPHATDTYLLPFESFSIGDEVIKNTRLRVAKSEFADRDMLLGADFFLSHRVMVAQSQRKLYFTYNGGPVFRLDDVRTPQAEARRPVPPPMETADADALARRAAASATRRDYLGAIADYDRAIALDPKVPGLYLERAKARLRTGDKPRASEDLARALQLKPDFDEALLLRGLLHLQAEPPEQANADFDAALAVTSDKTSLQLQIAQSYSAAGRFELAVRHYDAWLAANPKSFRVPEALNGRCWARALWGRELDKALADCDLALRRGSKIAGVLDSRGMVHLRRGEFDAAITDYDKAIELQPRSVWSLYGRGLARLKRGDAVGGAADLKAASEFGPTIAEDSKRLGLTEETIVVAQQP